ncbi:unnamed protein product [Soboliphyme baturini]|uniref:cDNA n=1 Tax=Soboliphyme baturini TaxID=241478 RepID=A0A183JB57_9BILA|nr:unnamed protein product [Soboliphyme baturini]
MWQWLGGPEGFSELEDWTQLQRASVSGFYVKEGCGMEGWPPGPWSSLPLWGFGLASKSFRSFCGKGGVLYSASGVPPKEGFQRRARFPGDWKTQTRHEAYGEGHNASLCPRRPSSMGVASWAMQVSPTLKVGHQANSKVSWMAMEEF